MVDVQYIDFAGLRTGASFLDLPVEDFGLTVREVQLPTTTELGLDAPPDRYVNALIARIGRYPSILAGYCGSCSLAYQAAASLEAENQRVTGVVLIDPPMYTPDAVEAQYRLLAGRLGGEIKPAQSLKQMVRALDDGYDAFLAKLPPSNAKLLASSRGETIERYAEWLAFIAAAAVPPQTPSDTPIYVVASRDWTEGHVPSWISRAQGLVRLDVSQDEILATSELADVLVAISVGDHTAWAERLGHMSSGRAG